MRKHHAFLCSVLSVATVMAQQPPTSSPAGAAPADKSQAGGAASASAAVPTGTAAAPAPAGAQPAPIAPPPSAGGPAPVDIPAPIEPPTVVPVATPTPPPPPAPPGGEPAPITPPAQAAAPSDLTAPQASGSGAPPPPLPPVAATGGPVAVPLGNPGDPVSGPPTGAGASIKSVNEFQGDDIGQVLRLLARQAGINMVVSNKVAGTITMRLENMTPLDSIKVIVTANNLDLTQISGVYYVKTTEEKGAEPTVSDNYTFSYATAEKVVSLLKSQLMSHTEPQFDQRTNTVFYRDFKSNLDNVRLFLQSIDRPTQQVMIEARLVEVNANPQQSYGVNWAGALGSAASAQKFSYGGSGLGSTGLVTTDKVDANGVPIQTVGVTGVPNASQSLQNFLIGGGGSGSNILHLLSGQFAILSAPQFSLTLRMLNEDSDAQFLANPRIVTANNLKADIKITRAQPVPKLTFNEQTAQAVFSGFDEKEYGNTLSVTPSINKDDFITMLVKPEISNKIGDTNFTFSGVTVASPIIDKRSLESTVLIKSGDTLAIGGLLQDETTKGANKVPIAGDIPVIGYLFQEHLNARTKRNLLVFVTPTIIKQGYGTGLEDQVSGLRSSGEEFADPNGWRNNAKGAIRLIPTSHRPIVADYPKPGIAPAPSSLTLKEQYQLSAPSREK